MSLMLGNDRLSIRLTTSDEHPVQVEAVGGIDTPLTPLVEVLLLGEGRAANQTRGLTRTGGGQALRYAGHHLADDGADIVWQRSTDGALAAETRIVVRDRSLAFQTTLTNTGAVPLIVESVTSGVLPIPYSMKDTDVVTGRSSWCAENRWRTETLEDAGLVDCGSARMAVPGSATIARVGRSTWTTDGPLPVGGLEDRMTGDGLAWQVAGGGPWRWELDSTEPGRFLLAGSGATHVDHAWSVTLHPGDNVTTPELIVASSPDGWDGAIRELTRHRRDDAAARTTPLGRTALVFNDYMNTLMADPTDEKLLPLIAAAADAGAEVFCIDAGWYDDSGDWWPSVGEWLPSTTRFGTVGLQGVLDAIRDRGMVPGLWLEPEVVGVRSPLVDELPPSAFLRRLGRPIVEHTRYFLDLRSAEARAHLDAAFDRLVAMGVGFFKLDYNVTPGLGADSGGREPGGGLQSTSMPHSRGSTRCANVTRRS
ncbi:MAG: alpha-galactosidase [Tessaracoccus sp.]|uniref:alpha-galactosidase n=1 Tax=Tessaracoccus sp. TaxID=1971211 RepID=UPI001EC52090|nr:alpha-galactosidase [Tessaracoccus sp.]MBK7820530.1 alpha-galactosidase [Tessaracoccus sp.]